MILVVIECYGDLGAQVVLVLVVREVPSSSRAVWRQWATVVGLQRLVNIASHASRPQTNDARRCTEESGGRNHRGFCSTACAMKCEVLQLVGDEIGELISKLRFFYISPSCG